MIIGGVQLPISVEVYENFINIKKAIDWASENSVDLLLTPECALSNYTWAPQNASDHRLKNLQEYLDQLVAYSVEKKVDLALGTAIFDDDTFDYHEDKKWFNQLRIYENGKLIHKHNKIMLTIDEPYSAGTELTTFNYKGKILAGLICNDLWVCGYQRCGDAGKLAKEMHDKKVELCLLASNAPRKDDDPDYFYTWSDIHVQTYSRQGGYVIAVSDNANSQKGIPPRPDQSKKIGSPSGVMDPTHGWMVKTPDNGLQYYKCNFV
jgi:predicted amidohydrolase